MCRKRASLALGLSLLAAGASGCFVFDEIDSGMKELERFDGAADEAPATPAAAPPEAAPQASWWEKARTLGSEPANERIVRCELDGTTQFMDRDDCLGRGGRPS